MALRLAVIGVGHLGKEHARILAHLPGVELVGVADVQAEQAQAVAERCGCRAVTDYHALLPLIDAAVIAVPTCHHHTLAAACLRRGLPLLVEKPLAATLAQADELVELARRQRVPLQVGHIERFNPVVEELRRHPLRPRLVEAQRLGPFTGRSTDIGVVLDLMIHDLDLLLALVPASVTTVEAVGVSVFGGHEDVAQARLTFADGGVATVTASRAHPVPLRRMGIWSAEGFVDVDFAGRRLTLMQPTEELRRHGLDPRRLDLAARARLKDEVFGRYLQTVALDRRGGDALTAELQHFVGCVRSGGRPRVSGEEGRNALALAWRVLEQIQSHAWDGPADGSRGPLHWPAPMGARLAPLPSGDVAA